MHVQKSPESLDEPSSQPCSVLDSSYDASLCSLEPQSPTLWVRLKCTFLAKLSVDLVRSDVIIIISTLGLQVG